MTDLAPQAEGEAALTLVQGEEIVFHVTPERQLIVHRLETKPADLHVTRFVGEGEFAAHAEAVLRARYGDDDVLLFQSGDEPDDLSFVFFDLPHRLSVLIAAPPVGERRFVPRPAARAVPRAGHGDPARPGVRPAHAAGEFGRPARLARVAVRAEVDPAALRGSRPATTAGG